MKIDALESLGVPSILRPPPSGRRGIFALVEKNTILFPEVIKPISVPTSSEFIVQLFCILPDFLIFAILVGKK